jgi:putative ABC transport system permease protein
MTDSDRDVETPAADSSAPLPTARRHRWRGLVAVGCKRTFGMVTGSDGGRIRLSVAGVAVAIGILVLVTGVGLGLTTDATVRGSDVDYWIVPEGGGGSALVDTGGPSLGAVHSTSQRIAGIDGVEYATPVLTKPLKLRSQDGTEEYVLAVGVVSAEPNPRIAGLSPAGLTAGDPHYAGGGYDGPWTGEVVASDAAAAVLNASNGSQLVTVSSNRTFTTTAITRSESGPQGNVPIVLVQLSELQSIVGATESDQADQVLVSTDSRAVGDKLEGIYPRTTVESRTSFLVSGLVDEQLPLALALTGLLASLVVGTLFVCTTMGMEIVADQRALSTMAALGLARRSRLVVVGVQTISVVLVGGIVGVILGTVGIATADWTVAQAVGIDGAATFHPTLLAYGILVAAVIGVFSLPYVLAVSSRVARTGGGLR